MTQQGSEPNETEEQLADALAQIESLQATAADAEARAATARGEADALREEHSQAQSRLAEAVEARESAESETSQLRADLEGARGLARAAAVRYREVRLASHPDIPGELVPEGDSVEEIDREFEAALKVVGQVRERVEEEQGGKRGARVPAGSPGRRAQDLGALPASEKIRLGLEQLSDRQGR
jgi:chromosome segregation ATPase